MLESVSGKYGGVGLIISGVHNYVYVSEYMYE
jgi:hypothetical protein